MNLCFLQAENHFERKLGSTSVDQDQHSVEIKQQHVQAVYQNRNNNHLELICYRTDSHFGLSIFQSLHFLFCRTVQIFDCLLFEYTNVPHGQLLFSYDMTVRRQLHFEDMDPGQMKSEYFDCDDTQEITAYVITYMNLGEGCTKKRGNLWSFSIQPTCHVFLFNQKAFFTIFKT